MTHRAVPIRHYCHRDSCFEISTHRVYDHSQAVVGEYCEPHALEKIAELERYDELAAKARCSSGNP